MPVAQYPPGWTCELIALRLEHYLLDTLPRGEALALAEHFEACVCCAQRLVLRRPDGEPAPPPGHGRG